MKNYNIGLDIGNTSVGWAVVDPLSNKVVRKNKKYLWGVRLFESAEQAVTRRTFRSTRRRYDRRRKRIKLLRNEFQFEINKVDKDFFTKLNQSFYNQEKDTTNNFIKLSKEDKEFKDYYNKNYKTIYHLRKQLIEDDTKCDIRLVYLAIHHIIKYRGNFLYQQENFSADNLNLKELIENLFNAVYELTDDIIIDFEDIINITNSLEKALYIKDKTEKKKEIEAILKDKLSSKFIGEFYKAVSGYVFEINKMLNIEQETSKITFKGSTYDEKISEIESSMPEKIDIIYALKDLYDALFLKKLFKGSSNTSISYLMVDRYNQHHKDLKTLKEILKQDKIEFKKMFKDNECHYNKYINNKITAEEFGKEINKIFTKIEYKKEEISNKIELGEFLPRISDADNGKYPYQLNKSELQTILKNQSKYYSFLSDEVDGKEKIIKLLEFRIPYYVGPLNNTSKDRGIENQNAWAVKKSNEVITPYNFDEIIDKEQSAINFIERMLGNCTYIPSQKAMANNSILYSEFKVLNELKQIKVNNEKLSHDIVIKAYKELFLNKGTINEKTFIDYLKSTSEYNMYSSFEITGYSDNKKFANNMKSYIDFFGENGYFNNTNYTVKDADNIIKYITVFEDKDILKLKLEKEYHLTNDVIKKLCSKKYSGWSNLSEYLLINKYEVPKEYEQKSIIDVMRETELNFMQTITSSNYKFDEMIKKENKIDVTKLSYSLVEELATSPATKRGIYQALKIVDELVKFMGCNPTNIILEMAREENNKSGRTSSKKDQLKKLYDANKNDFDDFKKINNELKSFSKDSKDISQKLFLYFIQQGKSLYTGKPLDINSLEECEIDHILPQSLIKDDSLDNKALVYRIENQNKKDSFVLPQEFQTKSNNVFWLNLKNKGFISAKKYERLIRKSYSNKDIEGFINRQLVETRQICKRTANILENLYQGTNIVYLNASLSHNYREKYCLYKFREINDYHHAHDAYLSAVLGQYKLNYFPDVKSRYVVGKNDDKYSKLTYQEIKDFNKKLMQNKKYNFKYGFVINSLDQEFINNYDTGEVFEPSIFNKTIENTLYRNDILVTKKTEIRSGELFNQTIYKAGTTGVPLKENLDTNLYGCYSSIKPSYAALISYELKGKINQKLVGIPVYIDKKNNEEVTVDYLKQKLNIEVPINLIKMKIPFLSTINYNGQICCLVGATDKVEVCNARQFRIDKSTYIKIKEMLNTLINNKKKSDKYEENLDLFIEYIILKIEKEFLLYYNLVEQLKEIINISNLVDVKIVDKENFAKEILRLLKYNSSTANMKLIPNKISSNDRYGRTGAKTISSGKIISKSVTGLYESTYEF